MPWLKEGIGVQPRHPLDIIDRHHHLLLLQQQQQQQQNHQLSINQGELHRHSYTLNACPIPL